MSQNNEHYLIGFLSKVGLTLLHIIWLRCKAVANVNTLKDPRAATFRPMAMVCVPPSSVYFHNGPNIPELATHFPQIL